MTEAACWFLIGAASAIALYRAVVWYADRQPIQEE